MDIDSGVASLGHLVPENIPYFAVNPWGKIRMQVSDGRFHPDLSVTDIRLYKSDQQNARRRIQASVEARLSKTSVLLAVGLTRPWKKNSDTVQRH